ncbi:MAG: methionyl-tRNA formyltransferase [Flavobacteriaceae bacterium]|nr:methionyl-tRNA formyltransferase [Flavobacteriaceae bacterium]
MQDLRIVFMGTPHFAQASLTALLENNLNVVAVITAADKPAGRGRRLKPSAVKEYALEKGLKVLQPTNLKDNEFIKTLETLGANLFIVVAFRMLPKVVWNLPQYGTFNLHASLLPQYRGAAPINWAIINGESKTGVTTFFIDENIDTGNIIMQKEVGISPSTTAGELHDTLMEIGSTLVIETIQQIKHQEVVLKPQPKVKHPKTAYKLNPDNTKINWELPIMDIYNMTRGLSPYPAAWCHLDMEQSSIHVKLYTVRPVFEKHQSPFGMIMTTKSEIKVASNGGYIIIEELKLEGKRKMDAKSLLNGFKFKSGAIMC